jgi:outer membrane protein OmpA-like peptidoglycan-associated protein
LPITGRGADRHIALSSGTLDFPATRRNQVRELQVTVSNTGEAPLALSGFSFSGDGAAAYSTNQTATTVGPNDDLVVSVFFRPTAAAGFSASMTIINDDDGLPMARVDLGGVGTLAPLLVSPGAITANVVPVGVKRRLPNPIVVTNPEVESAEIDVVCIGLAGAEACDPASPFQVAEWTGPRTLAGQTDVTLEVDFEPEVAGLYQGRVLVFVDGDPQPLLFVTVEGQGIDDVVLSGGGCAVGGEGGGDWWIVAIGVLALLVRRRVAWLALLLFASVAHADPATSFDLGVFRPTVPTRASFITVEPPEIHAKGVFGAGLTFDYAKNPLLAQRAGSDMVDAPVSDRSELILGLTYALPRVQLTLEIPGMSQAGSVAFTGVDAADGTALGDLSLHARFELWRGSAVALAASAQVTLPTGDEDAYAGSDGLVMKGVGILGVRAGRLRMAGNLGVRVRTSSAVLGNIEQGQEMVFGAGLAVRLLRGLDAIGEVFGSTPLGGEGRLTPLEGLVGTRVWVTEQVAFSAGGGMGLTSGVGAPDARVFVGVAWFPTESSLKGGKKTVAFGGILDVDEDGIPDQVDRCVNEAEDKDKHQDEDGCPELDNDSDGVLDVADKCPNEAEDGDEFQDADGCPEFDNDGDKVVDARDQCPQNKEDLDGFRDEDGCLDPDNDADGLPDGIDQCPLEPEVVNGNADDDGCPDPGDSLVMVFPDKLELLAPIEFAGETANLKPTSRPVLEQVATTLRLSPSIKVRVASHVHRRGGQQADYNLSVKRGEAVKKFLVDRGVDAGRLEMKPFGSTKPLGSRDVNDRIVFELVK